MAIFGGWNGKRYLSDVYLFDTRTMEVTLGNEDVGVGICPEYYPSFCDKTKIVFGNYVDHTLYSIELLSCAVNVFADPKPFFQ